MRKSDQLYWKQVAFDEIDEMIATVDRNGDGRISYSEFRFEKKNWKWVAFHWSRLTNQQILRLTQNFLPFIHELPLEGWYIQQIMWKWCLGSHRGLKTSHHSGFSIWAQPYLKKYHWHIFSNERQMFGSNAYSLQNLLL